MSQASGIETKIGLMWVWMVLFLVSGCDQKKAAGPPPAMVVQVVAVPVKRQAVSETLSLVADIAANEMVEIKAESEGIVQEILFQEGQRVEKGQLLLRLDESKWEATVAEAAANFKLSQANYDRSQQLLKDKLISQQEYDQSAAVFEVNRAGLELKRRQLKDARIFAPFAGVIGARQISPGQVITRNTILIALVDLDTVKVEMSIPEKFLSQLLLGQAINFRIEAYAGRKFEGKVYFIAPQVDPATRTALVKAQIPNTRHELKPGMFASLDLTLTIHENAMVIPEAALMHDGDATKVFIVAPDQTAQVRVVRIGERQPGRVEIRSGLEGNEQVIVEGLQKLVAGVKVKLASADPAAGYSDEPPPPNSHIAN